MNFSRSGDGRRGKLVLRRPQYLHSDSQGVAEPGGFVVPIIAAHDIPSIPTIVQFPAAPSPRDMNQTMASHITLPGGPLVIQTQGYTPRLWQDRQAIFFANLLGMFFGNERQIAALAREVMRPECYGARVVPIMGLLFRGGKNVAVLEVPPDEALCRYFESDLGLKLPQVHVLPHGDYLEIGRSIQSGVAPGHGIIDKLRAHEAPFVDGFVTDPTLEQIAAVLGKRALSTSEGSRRGNNKYLLHAHLETAGLPVFDTELADSPSEVPRRLASLAARGFRHAVVKSQIGASGVGLMKASVDDEHIAVPESFFHEGPAMVQGWVEKGRHGVARVFSPSVQMFLDDEAVYLYDLTEQILSHESVHQGNESPPPYLDEHPGLMEELFRQAGVAGQWLHDQGYRGTASADFLVTALAEPGAYRAYVCEINARLTGATYPSVLARHFQPRGAWLMRNLKLAKPVSARTVLRLLDHHSDLFHPGKHRGVLPVNVILNESGRVEKGQFLCIAPTTAECHEMLFHAERDLPIDWEYVRD